MRNDSDSHDIKPKYRVDNIQAISEALDICRRDFRCEEEWAFRWLCALLHEFYSVSEFAKEETKREVKGIKYRIANLNLKFLVALYNGREVIK